MSWLVSAKQYIPAVIGEPFGGGYFAGYISHTANGSPTHALIVAPRETGATGTGYTLSTAWQYKTAGTATTGTDSVFDGAANTAAMVTAGIADHPAAQFCNNLSIGGFADWYLPSYAEMNIAYFNLKPTTNSNNVPDGSNVYAVPQRSSNWTAAYPLQTSLALFSSGGQAFVTNNHWTSTQASAPNGWVVRFDSGRLGQDAKISVNSVRAFRRIAL